MESPYQWFDANKIAAVVTQTKKNGLILPISSNHP